MRHCELISLCVTVYVTVRQGVYICAVTVSFCLRASLWVYIKISLCLPMCVIINLCLGASLWFYDIVRLCEFMSICHCKFICIVRASLGVYTLYVTQGMSVRHFTFIALCVTYSLLLFASVSLCLCVNLSYVSLRQFMPLCVLEFISLCVTVSLCLSHWEFLCITVSFSVDATNNKS